MIQPSYPSLPQDPADCLRFLSELPDGFDFSGVLTELQGFINTDTPPYWTAVLGFTYWRHGNPESALASYEKVRRELDSDCTYQLLRGMAARKIPGCEHIAHEAYSRAVELDPCRSDALYNLGNLMREDSPNKAEQYYLRSLRLDPYQPMCWHNYGILLLHSSRIKESLLALRVSIVLDPKVPSVWCNFALALFADRSIRSAKSSLNQAITFEPSLTSPSAEQAIQAWESGRPLAKDTIDAIWDLALISLSEGDYINGWRYYEIRPSTSNNVPSEVPSVGPRLTSLQDAPRHSEPPLLVWCEQGLGDAIQFGRYLPILEQAGISFEFRCRESLFTLFRDWFSLGSKVVVESNATDSQDFRTHSSLMSLPHLFETTLATIPAVCPYIHPPRPCPEHLKVKPPAGGLSVGLVWAANPVNKAMYSHKSIALELLMPRLLDLLSIDLVELHCLQFGDDQRQLYPYEKIERVHDWSSIIHDFSDTAFVLNQLDLVITIDTAVAHLAGALNRPTWLLLHKNCDFRWLNTRSDSPWYPESMRLFRQQEHGDWTNVVHDLHASLDQLFLLDIEKVSKASSSASLEQDTVCTRSLCRS